MSVTLNGPIRNLRNENEYNRNDKYNKSMNALTVWTANYKVEIAVQTVFMFPVNIEETFLGPLFLHFCYLLGPDGAIEDEALLPFSIHLLPLISSLDLSCSSLPSWWFQLTITPMQRQFSNPRVSILSSYSLHSDMVFTIVLCLLTHILLPSLPLFSYSHSSYPFSISLLISMFPFLSHCANRFPFRFWVGFLHWWAFFYMYLNWFS